MWMQSLWKHANWVKQIQTCGHEFSWICFHWGWKHFNLSKQLFKWLCHLKRFSWFWYDLHVVWCSSMHCCSQTSNIKKCFKCELEKKKQQTILFSLFITVVSQHFFSTHRVNKALWGGTGWQIHYGTHTAQISSGCLIKHQHKYTFPAFPTVWRIFIVALLT